MPGLTTFFIVGARSKQVILVEQHAYPKQMINLNTCFSAASAGESVSRRRFESGTFFTSFSF